MSSSRNNTRHGLRSQSPVIPGLESPQDWDQHRTITIDGLAPATRLEEALAERIALILWRLGRVGRYERHVTTAAQAHAPDDLAAEYRDADTDVEAIRTRFAAIRGRPRAFARFRQRQPAAPMPGRDADAIIVAVGQHVDGFDLAAFGVPGILAVTDCIGRVPGWTVARIRQCVDAIAEPTRRDPAELIAGAIDAARSRHNQARIGYRALAGRLRDLRRERILPEAPRLESVIRYEAHLNRQLSQTLGQLQKLQQHRPARSRQPAYDDDHLPIDADPYPTPTFPLDRSADMPGTQNPETDRSNPIPDPAPPSQPPEPSGTSTPEYTPWQPRYRA